MLPAANDRTGASASAAKAVGTEHRDHMSAPVSRCVVSFGAGQHSCPGERYQTTFGRLPRLWGGRKKKQGKNFKTGARAPVFLRDRLSGTVQIRTVGGSVPPLQYPSPHSILQSRLKCGVIVHGKDVRIMLLKKYTVGCFRPASVWRPGYCPDAGRNASPEPGACKGCRSCWRTPGAKSP